MNVENFHVSNVKKHSANNVKMMKTIEFLIKT